MQNSLATLGQLQRERRTTHGTGENNNSREGRGDGGGGDFNDKNGDGSAKPSKQAPSKFYARIYQKLGLINLPPPNLGRNLVNKNGLFLIFFFSLFFPIVLQFPS